MTSSSNFIVLLLVALSAAQVFSAAVRDEIQARAPATFIAIVTKTATEPTTITQS